MTKAAIEEFLKTKKDENKNLLPRNEENKELNGEHTPDNNKSTTAMSPQPMILKNLQREIWSPREIVRQETRSNQAMHSEIMNLNIEDQLELRSQIRNDRSEPTLGEKKRTVIEIETKSNHITPPGSSLHDHPLSRSQLRNNPNQSSLKSLKTTPSVERGIVDINLR